jgi:hypothetical protein
MFTSRNSQEDIRKIAHEAGMSACEYHANVRQSIVLAYRSVGVNPTNDVVNDLAEQVQKEWSASHLYHSVDTPKSRFFAM